MSFSIRTAKENELVQFNKLTLDGSTESTPFIFKASLRSEYGIHVRAAVLAFVVCFQSQNAGVVQGSLLLLASLAAYLVVLALVWLRINSQAKRRAKQSYEHLLQNLSASTADKKSDAFPGSAVFVAVVGKSEAEQAETDKELDPLNHGSKGAVGMLGLLQTTSHTAELKHLFVSKQHRRQGAAHALLAHAKVHAKKHGIKTLVARVSSAQDAAEQLFSRAGFVVNNVNKNKDTHLDEFQLVLAMKK